MTRVVVVALIAWSAAAQAQSAGAQAEVLFRQGRSLMAEGKIAEACSAFAESQKLEPAVTTLINLAGCREKNNQLASAWGLFLDVERQTRGGDASARQLHDVAHDRAQKLEGRVSLLTIAAADPKVSGLEITRNGEVLDAATLGRALPIDGGMYTIAAHAPGKKEWSTTVTVGAEHDVKTVTVPKLEEAPAAVVATVQPVKLAPVPASVAPARQSKTVPILVGVGALALLGGSLAFELWGDSTYNAAKAEMTSQARRDSLLSSANDKRYAAEGLVVAGAATAGIAIWLYLRHSDDERSAATASRLVVTANGFAIAGGF